eukprot:CAMPEP_0115592130 /NCGR_PEP_ID=MMETSP0272-20121206/10630_1 /TAXON_ID=71861 /ORGANISM="Scrippsiella trochoidea, Strain CCMP3099" /LENGTH=54 /DNA_ID=CAMNT_0003027365 /DNA_START=62 /DNA_END=226 /DNA_ORIENTATION=+
MLFQGSAPPRKKGILGCTQIDEETMCRDCSNFALHLLADFETRGRPPCNMLGGV